MDESQRRVSFGTGNRMVMIKFDPVPVGPVLSLTPHQARSWAKLLTRMASLAERLPDKPKEDDHGSMPPR